MISDHSLLKIWNLNKYGGVIGIFNCQGAGSWPGLESNAEVDINFELSGKVSSSDIEYFEEVSVGQWTQDCAVFRFSTGMVPIVWTMSNVSMVWGFLLQFQERKVHKGTTTIDNYVLCLSHSKLVNVLYDSFCNFRVSNTTIKGRINWCHSKSFALWCVHCISYKGSTYIIHSFILSKIYQSWTFLRDIHRFTIKQFNLHR